MRYTCRGFEYDEGSPMARLSELENMIDDGELVRLPCKIGGKFYSVLEEFGEWSVEESEIIGVCLEKDKWCVGSKDGEFWEIGTPLCLLDREEAERILSEKEREE